MADSYHESGIGENKRPIPRWLFWSYWVAIVWGLLWLALYWNGSEGVLDAGHWRQLQEAADTTYPSSME